MRCGIAIVGAGISGLVVAHLLHRQHEISVYEAADYAGGHTNTIRVDTADETHLIDTGFIVFNDRNYPNFEHLLDRLGVPWQPSEMSFGVSDETGAFEYSSRSPPIHGNEPRGRGAQRRRVHRDGEPPVRSDA